MSYCMTLVTSGEVVQNFPNSYTAMCLRLYKRKAHSPVCLLLHSHDLLLAALSLFVFASPLSLGLSGRVQCYLEGGWLRVVFSVVAFNSIIINRSRGAFI